MHWTIIFVVFSVLIASSYGQLRCYSCSFTSVDSEQTRSSCLNANNATNNINCNFRYCTIVRQEFLDPPGVIASFLRGCDDDPDFLNHDVTDFSYRTFYRACTSNLCNTGNGIESVVGGGLDPNPQYTGDNLRVPGTRVGAAAAMQCSLLLLLFALLISI